MEAQAVSSDRQQAKAWGGELSSETQEDHGHVKGFREPAS